MDTRDQGRQIKLTGFIIRQAFDEILDRERGDEVKVNAPVRDEDGNFVEPEWPRFSCDLMIDGEQFHIEVWAVSEYAHTTLSLNWWVPGAGSVLPFARGYVDDDYSFRFKLWGGRQRLIDTIRRDLVSRDRLTEALSRAATRANRLSN